MLDVLVVAFVPLHCVHLSMFACFLTKVFLALSKLTLKPALGSALSSVSILPFSSLIVGTLVGVDVKNFLTVR